MRGGVSPVRRYIPELLEDVLEGNIHPGLVFDFTTDLNGITEAYFVMDERRAKQISRNAALALRADHENQLAIMGDPMGVYGRYTPPTMPITAPHGVYEMRNGIMFDDWNDGLEHWK